MTAPTSTTTRPVALKVIPENIPAELRAIPHWVTGRWEDRRDEHGHREWKKEPYSPHTGHHASVKDPTTWASFDLALKHYERSGMDFLWFALTDNDPYVVGDVDHVDDPTTDPRVQMFEDAFGDSYCEFSPSGNRRFIARGTLPGSGIKTDDGELYDTIRFISFTGHVVHEGAEILYRGKQLLRLAERLRPTRAPAAPAPASIQGQELSDDEVLVACRLGDPYKFPRLYDDGDTSLNKGDDSGADLALCNRLSHHSGRNFEQVDRLFRASARMRAKWDDPRPESGEHQGTTWGAWTINKAIESGHLHYNPAKWITLAATDARAGGDDDDDDDWPPQPSTGTACPSCCICCRARPKLETYALKIEAELVDARAVHREAMDLLRMPGYKPNEKIALLMAVYRWEEASSHDDDRVPDPETGENVPNPQAERKASISSMAESMGLSRSRASAHLKKWEAVGLLNLRLDRKPTPDLDPNTGEAVWKTETYLSLPLGNPVATLRAARATSFDRTTTWGGQRSKTVDVPTCTDHPGADHLIDFEIRCPEDDQITARGSVPVSRMAPDAIEMLMSHLETSGPAAGPPSVERINTSHLETSAGEAAPSREVGNLPTGALVNIAYEWAQAHDWAAVTTAAGEIVGGSELEWLGFIARAGLDDARLVVEAIASECD